MPFFVFFDLCKFEVYFFQRLGLQPLLFSAFHLLGKISSVLYFEPRCVVACEMGLLNTTDLWVLTLSNLPVYVFDWGI